jgi:hypothetical protein
MAKNSTKGLDYSADMVRVLRGIQSGIGNLAAAIATSLGVRAASSTPKRSASARKRAASRVCSGPRPQRASTIRESCSTPQPLSKSWSRASRARPTTCSRSSRRSPASSASAARPRPATQTTTGALDSDITSQIDAIIGQLYTSVVAAAKVLGLDVADALKTFQVEIGKISFKDLTGDEIAAQLNAIFSKIGDQMAGFAVAGLENFQKVGEGLYETLMRLAKDYLAIDAALKSIGMTFGAVGAGSIAMRGNR